MSLTSIASTSASVWATTEALATLSSTNAISPKMSPGESLAIGAPRSTSITTLPRTRENRAAGREFTATISCCAANTMRRDLERSSFQSFSVKYFKSRSCCARCYHGLTAAYSTFVLRCFGGSAPRASALRGFRRFARFCRVVTLAVDRRDLTAHGPHVGGELSAVVD